MSIQDSSNNNDDALEFPLRLSKICLLNIRDDNAFISPFAIQSAFHALSSTDSNRLIKTSNKKFPFYFYNYFILDKESIKSFREDLNEETRTKFHTEFQFHSLTDIEEKKILFNQILKHFTEQTSVPLLPSQKTLGQIVLEPMTLLTCISFIFRPFKVEHWEQLWSLKFHTNIHLSIETEFYFTKGFFRVAFYDTFHKIEIPGQIFHGIQMKLIILLPRCSSDLVHLYANIKEYLNLPFSSALIGVCIPKIVMDIDMNFLEALKVFDGLYNLGEFNEQIHLSAARCLGHFALDMSTEKVEPASAKCSHSIDLSPVTPWVFFVNRPFLFLITYGEDYFLIGQMLGPKIRQETNQFFSKSVSRI